MSPGHSQQTKNADNTFKNTRAIKSGYKLSINKQSSFY